VILSASLSRPGRPGQQATLRLVGNGAEPVSVAILRQFIDRFAAYGFRPGAMAPVYGLVENAVAVTLPPPGRPRIIDPVDRTALSRRGTAEPARPDSRKPNSATRFCAALRDNDRPWWSP
jgi:acyl-CoA synthetase (AMP-forming)/AMP-acid ligase II